MPAPRTIYLDHAATTPLAPEVRAALLPWLGERFGNPSSRHALGEAARAALDAARSEVAAAVGALPEHVTFTSGGTEANALAVLGTARGASARGRHVLVGPTEHPCVRDSARALADEGFEVETARLAPGGALDLADLEARLRPDTVLVAQMLANNEFGSLYPVRRVARLMRARSPWARLHVDAVQAFGKVDCALTELGADSLALSSHKVHGPQGIGALVFGRRAGAPDLRPLVFGGGQERGLRSGTENVAACVGFGAAARAADSAQPETARHLAGLRAQFVERLSSVPGARLLEVDGPRLDAIVAVVLSGAPAEVAMHHLEARGVFVSTGSACQARKSEVSPALLALGLNEREARGVLRVSFARTTTSEEVDAALRALAEVAAQLDG
jgi:cysteine desulfurase